MNKKLIGSVISVVAVVVLVIVILAAKNGDNNSTANNTPASDSSSSDGSSQSSDVTATNKVTIMSMAFSPSAITVKKGTQVTWTNQDSVQHNVTVTSGDGPKSQTLSQGDTYSYTFNTIGTFAYGCTFHPSMVGKVIVTE